VGERGRGVAVIRSPAEAQEYLRQCRGPVIAQEFVPGEEYGVFYYRLPGEPSGQLLSITRKELVEVTGDGDSTLEELILRHPRGLRMARLFLRRHRKNLHRIPVQGEPVRLGELGTHCRGALFTDARDCQTEALRKTIDEISQGFTGFYFGRYDLRAPGGEDLRRGTGIKILELNGVSAEATHIYQPGYPLAQAYRDLAEQWLLAFRIGHENRKAGARPTPLLSLAGLLVRHLGSVSFETPVAIQRHWRVRRPTSSTDPPVTPSKFTGSKPS